MSLLIKKINNHIVTAIPKKGGGDRRPVKGADLFDIYCNIYICSKKKSGKTSVIYKIIKEFCTKNVTIVAFVSTLHKDSSWEAIQDYCDNKGIPFIGHTSLMDDVITDLDKLDTLVKSLKKRSKDHEEGSSEPSTVKPVDRNMFDSTILNGAGEPVPEEEQEPKKTRSKYQVPEYFFIFDDISQELKHSASITSLLKDSRHMKAKVIISSQSWNDVPLDGRGQIDYLLLFKGIPEKKLLEIYDEIGISPTFEQFEKIYDLATNEPFNFLYIDKNDDSLRRNFNTIIKIGQTPR